MCFDLNLPVPLLSCISLPPVVSAGNTRIGRPGTEALAGTNVTTINLACSSLHPFPLTSHVLPLLFTVHCAHPFLPLVTACDLGDEDVVGFCQTLQAESPLASLNLQGLFSYSP